MARRWKTAIVIWIGILLYFGIGTFHPQDADLFLIVFYAVLLLAATIYTFVIWARDRARGEPRKSYHLAAYPRSFLRFVLDEREQKQERR
jgi:hypothetical protein